MSQFVTAQTGISLPSSPGQVQWGKRCTNGSGRQTLR